MKKEIQAQLRTVLHTDLAKIMFGMVKSQKYPMDAVEEMMSYVAVGFVNQIKNHGEILNETDLELILESTFDFAKGLTGGHIDNQMRTNVTSNYYKLIEMNPEIIEQKLKSVFFNVRDFIQ